MWRHIIARRNIAPACKSAAGIMAASASSNNIAWHGISIGGAATWRKQVSYGMAGKAYRQRRRHRNQKKKKAA